MISITLLLAIIGASLPILILGVTVAVFKYKKWKRSFVSLEQEAAGQLLLLANNDDVEHYDDDANIASLTIIDEKPIQPSDPSINHVRLPVVTDTVLGLDSEEDDKPHPAININPTYNTTILRQVCRVMEFENDGILCDLHYSLLPCVLQMEMANCDYINCLDSDGYPPLCGDPEIVNNDSEITLSELASTDNTLLLMDPTSFADTREISALSNEAVRTRKRRHAKTSLVVQVSNQIKASKGLLEETPANRLMVIRLACDIMKDRRVRPTHAASAVPLIVASVFLPLDSDIEAKAIMSSRAIQAQKLDFQRDRRSYFDVWYRQLLEPFTDHRPPLGG
jgi:hypothetical protein